MQKLPVTRDGKRGSEILLIDSDSVLRIDKITERKFVVHTHNEEYVLDISFESIEEWLFEDGFRMIDTTNIVNMNHVTAYDPKRGIVFFGNPSDGGKTASAARIHKEHIENVLDLLKQARSQQEAKKNDIPYHWDSIPGKLDDSAAFQPETADDPFSRSYETIRAVEARKRAEAQIKYMAFHDALTNLPNRLMFHQRLQQLFNEPEQIGKKIAVLFIDLDRTKLINDSFGHFMGDQLFRQVSRRLLDFIGEKGMVARFGGDEFLILLPMLDDIETVKQFAKNILLRLNEPYVIEGRELFVSPSIGISLYPDDGSDADTLIKHADNAMYRAKEEGGNTYRFYQAEMIDQSLQRFNLETQLHRALERNEITIYYQPILDLKTGLIVGTEALIRWNHPEMGMIPPDRFIPLAEENGLIVPIGNWVLLNACRQNKEWQRCSPHPLSVAVNISVKQFQQSNFVQTVHDTLKETGLDPALLTLEITENVAMHNVGYMTQTIDELKRLGVKISIDDFGTGYSALGYLSKFRVHTLKIDRTFIQNVTSDGDNAAIVTALIAMSQRLRIETLAEGVESEDQLKFLLESGCDKIQGYIFSKPLPVDQFEQLIRERTR